MNRGLLILMPVIAIILTACAAGGNIGKAYPTDQLGRLSSTTNTVTWTTGDYVSYRVEGEKLVGKLVFVERPGSSGNEFVRLTLVAWFADRNGLICAKSSCSLRVSDTVSMNEGFEFTIDIPKEHKNLEYVTFTYRGTYIS